MESVIEKLFYGKINPSETPRPGDAYTLSLTKQYRQSYEALCDKLEPPLKRELGCVVDDCTALNAREGAAFFVEGFRLGAAFMLDALHSCKTE